MISNGYKFQIYKKRKINKKHYEKREKKAKFLLILSLFFSLPIDYLVNQDLPLLCPGFPVLYLGLQLLCLVLLLLWLVFTIPPYLLYFCLFGQLHLLHLDTFYSFCFYLLSLFHLLSLLYLFHLFYLFHLLRLPYLLYLIRLFPLRQLYLPSALSAFFLLAIPQLSVDISTPR